MTNTYNYDLCVFIGRFQIFHEGHASIVKEALKHAQKVLIPLMRIVLLFFI
jgi:cytidyltransferase-like protein